jgi:hypothetical protein
MAKRLNEMDGETIQKNFLEENPEIPTETKVVIAKDVPRMEKIRFLNNRDPGCMLHFHYASKSHPLKHYDLMHGFEYDLPVEVIRHLEGQVKSDPYACHKRTYGRRMRDDGVSETFANGYVPYFQCQSVRAA